MQFLDNRGIVLVSDGVAIDFARVVVVGRRSLLDDLVQQDFLALRLLFLGFTRRRFSRLIGVM